MKIPARYLDLSVFSYPLNFGDMDKPEAWPEADVYPPPGFLPTLSLFDVGNGDMTGCYWPIGRENTEPLLCDTYHDAWSLGPQASSLEGFVKLKVAEGHCEPGDDDYQAAQELANQLGFDLPSPDEDGIFPSDLWLSLDPDSPAALKSAAAHSIKAGDLESAVAHLQHALQMLPEYAEAIFMLGNLYRRQRRLPEAAQKMVEVLSAPLCFGENREKALQSVKRLRDEDCPELGSDLLWSHRRQLTFATGVKRNDDFNIYEEAIDEYLRQEKGLLAVRLRVLVGELMWSETLSFRERYGYSMEKHRQLLRSEIEQAGLTARLVATENPLPLV